MVSWMVAASIALAYISAPQQVSGEEKQSATSQVAASQPASRPVDFKTTFRKPEQARILEELLRQRETPPRIVPSYPEGERPGGSERGLGGKAGQPLFLEGTPLMNRAGRYVVTDERPLFIFHADDSSRGPESMEILRNQYLEIMEDEAKAGVSEFVITAVVTSYRGRNYLLLEKVLRRVPNRNLSP